METMKTCPKCKEVVKANAEKCKHCGSHLIDPFTALCGFICVGLMVLIIAMLTIWYANGADSEIFRDWLSLD